MTLGNFEKHHILKLHGYFWGNLEFFGHFFPHTVTLLPYITWVTYWSIYNTTHGGHLLGTYKVRLFKKERIYMLRFQEPNFREWTNLNGSGVKWTNLNGSGVKFNYL